MIFGSLTSSGFGSYGRMLADFAATPIRGQTAVAVRFAPAAGFAGWFGVYQSARCMATRYAGEGQTVNLTIPVIGTGGDIAVIRHGALRDYSMQRAARTYSTAATRATMTWQ